MSDSPRLVRLVTGRDRDQLFPDEAASFVARAVAGRVRPRARLRAVRGLPRVALRACALGAFLLLSPTVHPWYAVWMLPLVAVGASPAWLTLAALVPLGYWPLDGYLPARAVARSGPGPGARARADTLALAAGLFR